jgi:hypothetical protein
MTDGITCYERDEAVCKDPICADTGCRMKGPAMAETKTSADLMNNSLQLEAYRRFPQDTGSHRRAFVQGAQWARQSFDNNATSPDLVQRCKEILEWNRTGLLAGGSGGAVRELADRLEQKIGKHYALTVAETQTRDDAMREVVRLAGMSVTRHVREDVEKTDGSAS